MKINMNHEPEFIARPNPPPPPNPCSSGNVKYSDIYKKGKNLPI